MVTMTSFDESLHPRQVTGEFSKKLNDAPAGTLGEAPAFLGMLDEHVPEYKIQPSDQPGIWLSVDRAAFLTHLQLPEDASDETVTETLRLLTEAQIDVAFIDQTEGYADPSVDGTPIDTTEWGPQWSDAIAWTDDGDPDARYVRATQTVSIGAWPAAAAATQAMTAIAEDVLARHSDDEGEGITVSTKDGVTFRVERTVSLPATAFSPAGVRDTMASAADPGADRLKTFIGSFQRYGLLATDAQLVEAESVNLDAVVAARRFGRPLTHPDLVALARTVQATTRGQFVKAPHDAVALLHALSRGYLPNQAAAAPVFDRLVSELPGADRERAALLAGTFRNA